jgi:hypothetical protein
MKEYFKHIFTDKIIRWGIEAAGFIMVVQILTVAILYRFLPPYIPLFNQMPWGEERLGLRFEIGLPIVVALFFCIINIFLLRQLYEKMPLVSRIISITTLLTAILSGVFIVRTLFLVL